MVHSCGVVQWCGVVKCHGVVQCYGVVQCRSVIQCSGVVQCCGVFQWCGLEQCYSTMLQYNVVLQFPWRELHQRHHVWAQWGCSPSSCWPTPCWRPTWRSSLTTTSGATCLSSTWLWTGTASRWQLSSLIKTIYYILQFPRIYKWITRRLKDSLLVSIHLFFMLPINFNISKFYYQLSFSNCVNTVYLMQGCIVKYHIKTGKPVSMKKFM